MASSMSPARAASAASIRPRARKNGTISPSEHPEAHQELVEDLDVVRDAGHHATDGDLVVEPRGELLEVDEQVPPQVAQSRQRSAGRAACGSHGRGRAWRRRSRRRGHTRRRGAAAPCSRPLPLPDRASRSRARRGRPRRSSTPSITTRAVMMGRSTAPSDMPRMHAMLPGDAVRGRAAAVRAAGA